MEALYDCGACGKPICDACGRAAPGWTFRCGDCHEPGGWYDISEGRLGEHIHLQEP